MFDYFEEVTLSKTLENIMKLGRPIFSEIVARPLSCWFLYSFLTHIFFLCAVLKKEYRKQNQGMNIVKFILEIMVIRLGVWVVLIRICLTRCIWLIHIVNSRVGIIWVKWAQCEIWIHIRIEKIIIVEFHFTNNHKNKEKANNKQKERKLKPSLY